MSKVNIEIDGQKLQVSQGSMVIEAADNVGIQIPRFCYHKKLSVAANCRMCLVQVENAPKPLPACATPVSEGMKVFTQSKIAKDAQKSVMEFLLINHPLDCPICDQGGQCELQDVALEYGQDISRFTEGKRAVRDKDIGPLIETEMTRCIHCTRCVRFGTELAGIRELGATGRGEHMTIGTFIENSVDSEVSGNVIDLCPVGALTAKPSRYSARAWEIKSRASIASHDSLGSNIFQHTKYNKVLKTVPREHERLNETWLSDRDRFSYEGYQHAQRLLEPEIKIDGQWQTVSWEVILKTMSERLARLLKQPEQFGAIASSSCTTEEYYLLAKLLRHHGVNNLDYRGYVVSDELRDSYHPAWTMPLDKVEQSPQILLVGCHPRIEMPLLNMRLLKAHHHGAQIMGIQAFKSKTRYPMAHETIVDKGDFVTTLACVAKLLCQKTNQQMPSHLQAVASQVSVSDEDNQLADKLLAKETTIIIGESIFSHPRASLLKSLCAQIAKVLHTEVQECIPGSNAAGARLAGFSPTLAGIGASKTPSHGLNAQQMLSSPLKGMLLMNVEPEFEANPHLSMATLQQVDEVFCITPFVTDLMREYADILLPMAPHSETDGTLVNMFGQLQSFRAVNAPHSQAKPGWKILRVLGNFLHVEGFDYNTADEVLEELKTGFDNFKLNDSKMDHWLSQPVEPYVSSNDPLIRVGITGMYRVDNVVRRAASLQQTQDNLSQQLLSLHPITAAKLQIADGEYVGVVQDAVASAEQFKVVLSHDVPKGSALLYGGFAQDLGATFAPIELQKLS